MPEIRKIGVMQLARIGRRPGTYETLPSVARRIELSDIFSLAYAVAILNMLEGKNVLRNIDPDGRFTYYVVRNMYPTNDE